MSGFLPNGMAETLPRQLVDKAYPVLGEVQRIVTTLLDTDDHPTSAIYRTADGVEGAFRFGTTYSDTPALALRALEMHRGGTLPTYEDSASAAGPTRLEALGQTREITPDDSFAIVAGPVASDPPGRFITWLVKKQAVVF